MTFSIVARDPEFAQVYIAEKQDVIDVLLQLCEVGGVQRWQPCSVQSVAAVDGGSTGGVNLALVRAEELQRAFKAQHGVATTPQIFVDGHHIGGADELEGNRHLIAAISPSCMWRTASTTSRPRISRCRSAPRASRPCL